MHHKNSTLLLSLLIIFNIAIYSTSIADTLQEAEQAIAKKEYSTAIIHLKNQLKTQPQNAQARYLLGGVYLRIGKLNSGIKELGRAHEYAPDNSNILLLYAEALQAGGKYKKSVSILNQYPSDKQQDIRYLSHLGNAHLGLGQLADAKQAFNEANQQQESVMAFNGLVNLALREQDLERAENELSKSLAIDPNDPGTLQLKAKLANLNQQHEQALVLYNQLIAQDTNNLSIRLERAATLTMLKKDPQAKADLIIILERVKNHPRANYIYAQILLRELDFSGAKVAAQKAVNVNPQFIPAILILGAANFSLKHYNQAEENLIMYLSTNSLDIKAQNLLANIYLAQGKIKQALLVLHSIPQEQRNADSLTLLTLGNAYLLNGDTTKGIETLSHAQAVAPDNMEIKRRLIVVRYQSGEFNDAINELEQLSASEHAQIQTNYLLIISYIKQKQVDKADEKVNQLLTQTPDDTKLQHLKALIEQLKGNTDKSIARYQAILKQDKENISAYMGLGRIAANESNWQDSERYFKQVIRIDPDTIKAHLRLAVIAEKLNKPQAVEQHFMDAIERSKTNIPYQLSIAKLLSQWYSKEQQPEKILLLGETLVAQHPNNNTVRSFLASGQLLNQKNKQAERTLKSLLAFDRNDMESRILLVNLISQEPERSNEALSLLRDGIAIQPDNMILHALKAAILIREERYEDAMDVANDMKRQFPDSVSGELLEADIYRARKQYEKALSIYLQVYQEQPDRKILSSSVDTLLVLNQRDKAIILLLRAVDKDPEDMDSLFKLASLYLENQQLALAERYYKQLLKIVPNHAVSLNNLAWIYYENNIKQAVKLARRAYEIAPQSASIMDSYGYFLVKDGQNKKGLELLKKAAETIPQNNDIQYHLALAYEKTGQHDKAMNILDNIVNSKKDFSKKEEALTLYKKLNK